MATDTYDPIPETSQEALARWDSGDSVFTLDMGGMGPGYEQCIHILAFEIIRDHLASGSPVPATDAEWQVWGDEAVGRTDATVGGYSGAQVGAAKKLAAITLRRGWRVALRDPAIADRLIQVSKNWPRVSA